MRRDVKAKVDGVYTRADKDPTATLIREVTFHEVLTRELKVMDAAAVSLCKENNLPIIVLNINEPGAVASALRGEKVGTFVS